MRTLANVFALPQWAANPEIAPLYLSALRRLVTEFSESLSTAQLLLDNWHRLVDLQALPATTAANDPFRDFWPWYSDLRE